MRELHINGMFISNSLSPPHPQPRLDSPCQFFTRFVEVLLHDPPNSHPRSRLIPFLPLASILAPASCRMPFLPFNYRLSYTAALSCRVLHILPLSLSQSSLCSCARFVHKCPIRVLPLRSSLRHLMTCCSDRTS
jgi:hypothetical protein